MASVDRVIDLAACPLDDDGFVERCRAQLDRDGVVTIPGFLRKEAVEDLVEEAESGKGEAFFTSSTHNVYLTKPGLSDEAGSI